MVAKVLTDDQWKSAKKSSHQIGRRYLGNSKMNYYEAMRLLDQVKDGQNIPTHLIRQALILTGDLDE
jgi:hypothetical protein